MGGSCWMKSKVSPNSCARRKFQGCKVCRELLKWIFDCSSNIFLLPSRLIWKQSGRATLKINSARPDRRENIHTFTGTGECHQPTPWVPFHRHSTARFLPRFHPAVRLPLQAAAAAAAVLREEEAVEAVAVAGNTCLMYSSHNCSG